MPSRARTSNMPAVIITRSPSPPKQGVAFNHDPVQSISRPSDSFENTVLQGFEHHARACPDCHLPYIAYQEGHRLCEAGHHLAQQVAVYLYNIDGDTFSARDTHRRIRVEIPANYDETRGLLKAIERGLRSRRPFVSIDRTYSVQPRTPERRKSVKVEQPSRTHSHKHRRHSRAEIVEWPESHGPRTTYVHRPSSHSHRGSLYEEDLVQQKHDLQKYKVEVREPRRSSGYYR